MPRRGRKNAKIESMGCQEGGGKIDKKSLLAWVAKKGGEGKFWYKGNHWKHGLPRRRGGGGRKSFKAWVAKREGGKNKIKKSLKARVAKKGGGEKLIKRESLRTWVLKTRRGQGEGGISFKAWVAKTKRGGIIFDKKKIIEGIESMGCQERGGEKKLIKRKSLKAWVAKKGGEEKLIKSLKLL